MFLSFHLLSTSLDICTELGSDSRVFPRVPLPNWRQIPILSHRRACTHLLDCRVDHLVVLVEVAAHAGSRFRIVEVEGIRFRRTQVVLLLLFLEGLLEGLLETLEIRHGLSLRGLESELVLIQTLLYCTCILLKLLLLLVFLHPRR